jgi:hypothetical protein
VGKGKRKEEKIVLAVLSMLLTKELKKIIIGLLFKRDKNFLNFR